MKPDACGPIQLLLVLGFFVPLQISAQANSSAGNAGGLLYAPSYQECLQSGKAVLTRKSIYHEGWIDLNKNGKKDVYEDASQPVDKRLDDLLSQMSLEEKTAQMATLYGYQRVLKDYLPTTNWFNALWKDGVANIDEQLNGYPYGDKNVPGAAFLWPASKHAWALNEMQRFFIEDTRLGVPAEFTDEGIRGVEHYKATCFPTQLGLGQTWDRVLIRQVGEVTGREAHALGYANVYAPILDVMRDPRWGRCEESYGEDPYLVSELAIQMVNGMQAQQIVSTMKHFCIYASDIGAREGHARTDPQIPAREAEMIHLWPYERVIREANPLGVMSSYNDYDGSPITGSAYFLTDVLRKRFGFRGYVVSDSDAVEFLERKHHVAASYKEAVRQAVMAGLNVRTTFTPPEVFVTPLRELVREGAVPMAIIDSRVRDVLRVKFWEGLFDQPYRPLTPADTLVLSPEHRAIALMASRESLVLLKNENHLLPLDAARIKSIALCGPNADNPDYARGHYGPGYPPVTTVRQALEKRFGPDAVLFAKGCDFFDARWPDTEIMREAPTPDEQASLDSAVANAQKADICIVVVGDMPRGRPEIRSTVGEDSSRTGLDLTGRQDDLIRAIAKLGKPMVVVNISGRPVALNWANRLCPAILQAFFPGMEGGTAIVEALFGDCAPGGKLTCTFPKSTGQLPMVFPNKPSANDEPTGPTRVNVAGVLWPFGHGLSYTTFEYGRLHLDPERQATDGIVHVSFQLTNSGSREADEVPQLYIRQETGSVTTWEKRLCGFERIHLKPQETRTVSFAIAPECLAIWNRNMERVVEPGKFTAMIGSSSADIRLSGQFEMSAVK
ncbi:MAG TPA: glycoside hydrolase family 3 N-terminal domain-containing protein [Verrucomicrobiae bacterium]|nr:glycoside hydrolase family 3 N-terminal domain-containing protein [Verrucomicrobiae bacterium]